MIKPDIQRSKVHDAKSFKCDALKNGLPEYIEQLHFNTP